MEERTTPGDCISPNGQKLRQPSDIVPFYNTVSSEYFYGQQHFDRRPWEEEASLLKHGHHYFRRCTALLFYAFNLLQGWIMFNLLMTTLEN